MRGACEAERRALLTLPRDVEINRPVFSDGDGSEIGDLIPADGPSPLDLARRSEMRAIVERAFRDAGLDSREEQVIRRRFGIGTLDSETLEEIGESMGVCRERIRQVEVDAKAKLATYLAYRLGLPEPDKFALAALRRRTLQNSRKRYQDKLKKRLGIEGYRAYMREQRNACNAKKREAV